MDNVHIHEPVTVGVPAGLTAVASSLSVSGSTLSLTGGTLEIDGHAGLSRDASITGYGTVFFGGLSIYSGSASFEGGTISVAATSTVTIGSGRVQDTRGSLTVSSRSVTDYATFNSGSHLVVGDSRAGALNVTGGRLNSVIATIGSEAAGSATVTSGLWSNTNHISIGTGTLEVSGGAVNTGSVHFLSAVGRATVSGNGLLAARSITGHTAASLQLAGGTLRFTAADGSSALPVQVSGSSKVDTDGFDATLLAGFSGAGTLVKQGGGTLTVQGRGDAASIQVEQGTLAVASDSVVTTGDLVLAGTGSFRLATGSTLNVGGTDGIRSDAGTGSFQLAGGLLKVTNSSLTTSVPMALSASSLIDTSGVEATFSGVLSGPGVLSKTGAGTLHLRAANTHAGGTTLFAGELAVNNATGSGTGSGPVAIAAGAWLTGHFTIAGSTQIDGTLSPGGTAVGAANFGGNLTFGSLATTRIELASASSFDTIRVGGTLTLDGTIVVITSGGHIARGSYQVLGWSALSATGFNVATDLDLRGAALAPGDHWDTSQFLTTGTLAAVPEPAAWGVALAALLAGLIAWRRRPTKTTRAGRMASSSSSDF